MPDWTASMKHTFEYYLVDPGTWKDIKRVENVKRCSITRDIGAESLGSAAIDMEGFPGEFYIRIYLVVSQNGQTEKIPLGTMLMSSPSSSFDGKVKSSTIDGYTPLMELKENVPPLGYSLLKDEKIMDAVYRLVREHARAPVARTANDDTLTSDFVSDPNDTWLTFISDLAANAKYSIDLDEMGRIIFSPERKIESMQPVWTYNDDNSSILYPELEFSHDLYGIPNVVEVIYSTGRDNLYARAVNDDPNSPTSTVARGREIVQRVTNPSFGGRPSELQVKEYAEQALSRLSTVEYTISYTHGYCPVRVGDCVRLNYNRAGLTDVKAMVTHQNIKCEPGCPVSERAVFTTKLWGGSNGII